MPAGLVVRPVVWIFRVQKDFRLVCSHLQVTFSQFVP